MADAISSTFRRCKNIKSQKNPDVQCPYAAASGEYCLRHSKQPRPFNPSVSPLEQTKSTIIAVKMIQAAWRRWAPRQRARSQGPAANAVDLATNDTELYSFDPISSVPPTYRFSFADERKSIWLFDIRTLVHTMATGFAQKNPYTRDPFSDRTLDRLYRRIGWLRARKYPIRHATKDILTPEQAWNQQVLDVFLAIEALGFYMSCDWFHQMSLIEHRAFYKRLYALWTWRMGLTMIEKEQIVPGHLTATSRLFSFVPGEMGDKELAWWQKQTLSLMNAFISRAIQRESRKLGAMYVIMALGSVVPDVAEAFPWLFSEPPG